METNIPDNNGLFDEAYEINRRKKFSNREVGLNHPDNSSFVRVADSGEIEIFGCPGVGIVINPNTRSVSIFADSIKFYSREDDGLRWNSMSFNPASDMYNEPALVKTGQFANNPAYYNTIRYLTDLENLEDSQPNIPVTIEGRYGLGASQDAVQNSIGQPGDKVISENVQKLIDSFAKTNSDRDVEKLISYLKSGYSFSQAVDKINNKDNNLPENLENFPWIENDV